MNDNFPRRMNLAHLPTPIQKFNYLTGPKIYIKRDDLTGMLLSGNKIRKLEFVVADARNKGADTLITCGGVQSNHARATAVVATQLGMKSVLVLRGKESDAIDGNLLIDRLVGAEVRFITPEQYSNEVNEIMADIAKELAIKGQHPYVIPEGASNALGSMGYVDAVAEIITQLRTMNLEIDAIVCATGSGGTQAGLILGRKILDCNFNILGVNVCDDEAYFKQKITSIMHSAIDQFELDMTVTDEDIRIADGYVGEGYALNRPQEIELIRDIALKTGIILDPVYTGKAMLGLLDHIKQGTFSKNHNILFLHSGGLFGLFPKKNLFTK